MTASGADLNAKRAADFEVSPQTKIKHLERTLADERKHSVRATTQLHKALVRDLAAAEKRADAAEKRAKTADKRAKAADKRAKDAESRLEAVLGSTSWRTGQAIVSVPGRIKRRVRRT